LVEQQHQDKKQYEETKRKFNILEVQVGSDYRRISDLETRCNKYHKTSEMLKVKAKNVLEMSQNFPNDLQRCSPPSAIKTTKNKTQSSFNLSQTETEKQIDSTLSKVQKENSQNESNKKLSSEKELTLNKNRQPMRSILKNSEAKRQDNLSANGSEQVEFNVYDFTRQKGSTHYAQEINNTRDTAEFGDHSKSSKHIEREEKDDDKKVLKLQIDEDDEEEQPESEEIKEYIIEVIDTEQNCGTDPIPEEFTKSEKENVEDNFSSGKKSLQDHFANYFSRFNDDGERKLSKFDQHKASSLSLHPSKIPKYPKSSYSPVNTTYPENKYKTTNKKELDALNLSHRQQNACALNNYPKNLVPVNLNASLSK